MQQIRKSVGPDPDKLNIDPNPSDRFVFQGRFVPLILKEVYKKDDAGDPVFGSPILTVTQQYVNNFVNQSENKQVNGGLVERPADDIEQGSIASDLGIILLERTRFRPAGFMLGEHIHSLSLAPGEEVTLEQKTFSERSVIFEDINESDTEINNELGSSLTTEISEALNKTLGDTKNKGTNIGGQSGASYNGFNLSVSGGYTDNITSALSSTESETVRNVMTKTEKLAARRRAQHKITMKISETSRYETGSKRVIRNPNQFTPIDLVYFKLLQKLEVSQERYGVRLSWAPFIRNPGFILDEAEAAARKQIESGIPLNIPSLRPAPTPSEGKPNYQKNLGSTELTNWGLVPVMMIADYDYTIWANNPGDVWDGQNLGITNSNLTFSDLGPTRGIPSLRVLLTENVFDAQTNLNGVKVRFNVTTGPGWPAPQPHIYFNFSAGFTPDNSAASDEDKKKQAEWEAERNALNEAAARLREERTTKVEALLTEWRKNYMKNFDPVSSAFQLLIAQMFPLSAHDESYEVEIWNKIFDFDSAAFQYYPCWWSNRERRNPEKAPDAFENASWMRVFLPVRLGFERLALNLITERRMYTQTGSPEKLNGLNYLLDQLNLARKNFFGGESEITINPSGNNVCPDAERPYLCLAHWNEFLPTDGTHLEVTQAKTTAIDDTTEQSLTDTHDMVIARTIYKKAEGELSTSVKDKITSATAPADLDIHIGLGTKKTD